MSAKQPLDKLSLPVEGVPGKTIPAIHRHWVKDITFVKYPKAPVPGEKAEAAWEEWSDVLGLVERDLRWVLGLSHHQFWSQLIFNRSLRESVESFLQHAPRYYDKNSPGWSESYRTRSDELERLYFLVILRMSTNKESEDCFITPGAFADIVYNEHLFDIPKLVDICAIFSKSNQAIVTKLVDNVFKRQPRYMDDLRTLIPNLLQIFLTIQDRCAPTEGPVSAKNALCSLSCTELEDIILYACDSAYSLYSFVECYRPACEPFFANNFCIELCNFYEYAVLEMEEAVNSHKPSDFDSCGLEKSHLICRIYLCKDTLLKTYHSILYTSTIQSMLEASGSADPHTAYGFVDTLNFALSQPNFILNYNRLHPVQDDFDILKQMNLKLDHMRMSFVLDSLSNISKSHPEFSSLPVTSPSRSRGASPSRDHDFRSADLGVQPDYSDLMRPSVSPIKSESNAQNGAGIAEDPEEIILLISQVKELFPDLGDGFIEKCLVNMDLNSERVINAILEDSLPPNLQSLDRQMERKPKSPTLLSQRRNIFDNDEFDVFNRADVDLTKVHRKKDVEPVVLGADLPDSVKAVIHAAAAAQEEEDNEPLYNDDYDDTYDGNEIGADDADSAEEYLLGRKVVTPLALRRLKEVDSDDQYSSGGSPDRGPVQHEDNEEKNPNHHRQFRNQHQQPSSQHPPSDRKQKHDVKGKAKGQGQTKEVLHNRNFKDKHKSSMANHNRKKGADRKMAQGMF